MSSGEVAGIVIGVIASVLLLVGVASVVVVWYQRSNSAEHQAMNLNFTNPTYAREEEAPINDMFNNPYTHAQRIDSVDESHEA